MRPSTVLRRMLDEPEIIVLPGAYDALTARLAERVRFSAVASGLPRVHARPASGVVGKPLIATEQLRFLLMPHRQSARRRKHRVRPTLKPLALQN